MSIINDERAFQVNTGYELRFSSDNHYLYIFFYIQSLFAFTVILLIFLGFLHYRAAYMLAAVCMKKV